MALAPSQDPTTPPGPAHPPTPPLGDAVRIVFVVAGVVVATLLAAGLLLAVLLPASSFLREVLGPQAGVLGRTAAFACSGVLGRISQLPPGVVGAVPLPGLAVVTVLVAARTAEGQRREATGLSTREAVACASGAGLPVAVVLWLVALAAGVGGVDLSLGSVVLGSLLVTGAGAVLGVLLADRKAARAAGRPVPRLLAPPAARWAAALGPPLLALLALGAVATLVGMLNGLGALLLQPLPDGVGAGRAVRILDLLLAAPDVAIGASALTLMSGSEEVFFALAPSTEAFALGGGDPADLPGGLFVLFGTLPWPLALLEALLLLVALLVCGVAAGALAARRGGARGPEERLGMGALTGVVWLLVPVAAWLTGQGITGGGQWVGPLLLGGALGATGGLLAGVPIGPWRERLMSRPPPHPSTPSPAHGPPPAAPWSRRAPSADPPARAPYAGPAPRGRSLWGPGATDDRPTG